MSDSDLYGDIYGDDDAQDYTVATTEQPEANGEDAPATDDAEEVDSVYGEPKEPEPQPEKTAVKKEPSSLPAKPIPAGSNSLSYSAQIAQQFSATHRQSTPSQQHHQQPTRPDLQTHKSTSVIAIVDSTAGHSSDGTVYGKKPSEMHDAGKMFIGGLSWDTTDEGLKNYFSEFGKVDAVTIMRDPNGRSRGFAFLTFEDPAAVNAVVVREHHLDGKAIDPKRAIPREEHLRNTRFFVGGLAGATTSESMKQFFLSYGRVADATVMVDRESGRSKGFGFVTFEEIPHPEQIIGKIGLVLDDKEIEVKMAQPRSQRDQQRAANEQSLEPKNGSTFISQPMNSMFNQRGMSMMNPMMGNMGMMPMMMGIGGMGSMPGMGMGGGMGNMTGMMGGMGGMGNMAGMGGMAGMAGMGGGTMTASGMGTGMASGMGAGGMGTGIGAAIGGGGMTGGGMGGMGNAGNMGMGSMRMGMGGPMGNFSQMGAGGMGGMGMGMVRPGMMNSRMGSMGGGTGPARVTNRGQNNFHPYAR